VPPKIMKNPAALKHHSKVVPPKIMKNPAALKHHSQN
jgi:hypothetical protein